jgi:4a-hydroxytetrahydrobiopterin dehydratase
MSTATLAQNACVPVKSGTLPLAGDKLHALHKELDADWLLMKEHHLEKDYKFKGYAPAVAFTNAVAAIAEKQDHHPDLLLTWGKVQVTIWTHKIDGLTESDFYFAAKVEEAFRKLA